jgi:hypothetical protein
LFEVLANNEIIPDNFIKKSTFGEDSEIKPILRDAVKIYAHLETNDPCFSCL